MISDTAPVDQKTQKIDPRADWERKVAKGCRPTGWGQGPGGPQGAAPKYAHASKEGRGAAERKKKQERKKGYVEQGYKRDLNTLVARGPAN